MVIYRLRCGAFLAVHKQIGRRFLLHEMVASKRVGLCYMTRLTSMFIRWLEYKQILRYFYSVGPGSHPFSSRSLFVQRPHYAVELFFMEKVGHFFFF